MILQLSFTVKAMAITATVSSTNTPYTGQTFDLLGDAVGQDAGTINALGPNCQTFSVPAPEYPHLVFDFGST